MPEQMETNEDMKITRQQFEAYYYNCEEDLTTHEVFMPIDMAKELNLTAKQLDFISRNLIPLKQAFIDGTHCQDCFAELPPAELDDLGEGYSQLVTTCIKCGRSYTWRS